MQGQLSRRPDLPDPPAPRWDPGALYGDAGWRDEPERLEYISPRCSECMSDDIETRLIAVA